MHYPPTMNSIEDTYALLGLTEDVRSRIVQLTQLAQGSSVERQRIVVETVVVKDGARKVIEREERGG